MITSLPAGKEVVLASLWSGVSAASTQVHFQDSGHLLTSMWLIPLCSEVIAALYPLHIIWAVPPSSECKDYLSPEFLAQC